MGAITDAEIRAAIRSVRSGDRRRVILSDGSGRGGGRLQVMVRNAKSGPCVEWYAVQHTTGKRRMAKIGVYPETPLTTARAEFAKYSVKIRQGVSVRHAKPLKDDFESMLTAYVDQLANEQTREETRRVLLVAKGCAADAIGRRKKAADVTTQDIVAWLRPYHARGALAAADAARKKIRAAFQWAIGGNADYTRATTNSWGLTVNPAANIKADPDAKQAGERFLSAEEFRALLLWLRGRNDKTARCVELIALTGQRVMEIANLTAAHRVDRGLYWPNTKTEKPHFIPVVGRSVTILDNLHSDAKGYLFDERDPAKIRDYCVQFCAETGTPHFTTRDLRRTWKTLAGVAGVSKEDRDRLQNHAKADVSSVHYDRYEYLPEKTAAVEKWSAWVDRLTSIRK